jgi:hypothetical protein
MGGASTNTLLECARTWERLARSCRRRIELGVGTEGEELLAHALDEQARQLREVIGLPREQDPKAAEAPEVSNPDGTRK